MTSVSMVKVQKGSRGLLGTKPLLSAPGHRGDPEGKVDYKDFLLAVTTERRSVQLQAQGSVQNAL